MKLALAATALVVAAGATATAWPASGHIDSRSIALLAPPGGKTTDIAPPKGGPRASGAEFISTNAPLVDPKTKKRAGTMDATETILSVTADREFLTARLARGTLEATGERRHPGTVSTLAVTGGTGVYAGARGTVALVEIGETGGARLTFRLEG